MSKEKTLLKNTAIVTIGKICTQLISFFLLPLYTTFLTAKEYGVVDILNTLISLLIPVLTFQLDQGIFRFLIDNRENEDGQKKLLSTITVFIFRQIAFYLIIFLLISPWIANEYKYFLASNLIASACANILLQVARGLGDNTKYTIGSFLSGTVTIVLNLILIAGLKLGAYGMLYSSLIGNIMCIVYVLTSLKLYKKISFKGYNKTVLKEVLKYSVPLIPNAISWWVVNVSDRIIITYFMNVAVNGIYSVANKFSAVLTTIYGVFNITWTEAVSVNFKSKDRDEFFNRILDVTIRFFGALCLGMIAYMPFVFKILINEAFAEAYMQIPILIIGAMFNILVSFLGTIYVAKKLTKEIAKISLVTAIINIVINVALINFIGLYAASISTLVAWMVMFIYRYIDCKKYVKLKANLKIILPMIGIGIITLISYYLNNSLICLLIAIIVTIYTVAINLKNMKFLLSSVKGKFAKK